MQAQTTRTFNGSLHKVAGGLLISAALIVGAIGVTNISGLEIPGTGSDTIAVPAPALDRAFAPHQGEGLPLALETTSIQIDRVSYDRQIAAPQGEGYPLAREIPEIIAVPAGSLSQTRQLAAPQGEGFPLIEQNSFDYVTPMTIQQIGFVEANAWDWDVQARPAGGAEAESAPDFKFLEENSWDINHLVLPKGSGSRDY